MGFGNKVFRSARQQTAFERSFIGKYQRLLKKNIFLFYGVPFCGMIVIGSYWLAGFTAVKYEREDRRIHEFNEDDVLKLKRKQRKVDVKEEYYRLQGLADEDWEPVRVERLEGESENVW